MTRPAFRLLHRWLGLTVGLWAAVAGLTGSVLVFSDALETRLAPELRPAVSLLQPAEDYLDRAGALLANRYPAQRVQSWRLPRESGEPLLARLGTTQVREVIIDPVNLDVLGERPLYSGPIGFIRDLHIHLLAGETGETIAGFLGLLLTCMLLIGLGLWWPRKGRWARSLKVRWRAPLNARLFDWHGVIGALSLPLLMVPVVTGLMLVFHGPSTAALLHVFGGADLELPKVAAAPEPASSTLSAPLSATRLLQAGQAALPDAQPVSLRLPNRPGEPAVLRLRFAENTHPNGRSFVALHPHTGEVLGVHSWRQAGAGLRASDFKYPLHIGQAFGLPGRITVLLTGLLPSILLVTGGWLWWRKRRAPRRGLTASPPVS